jgi:adenylate cyclase
MTKIVLRYKGTVDKYIGDEIMAFWNATLEDKDHAKHACQCALDMLKEIEILNKRFESQNKPIYVIKEKINL